MSATNLRKAALTASSSRKMSAWSNSTDVSKRRARPVVQELGALVEEGRVVLVALDDELGALPEAPRLAEVQRHAADQETTGRAPRRTGRVRGSTTSSSCRASRPRRPSACPRGRACRTATGTTRAGSCARSRPAPRRGPSGRRCRRRRTRAPSRGSPRGNPRRSGTPSSASCVDIGGYTCSSDPRTSCPAALSSPASEPIPVPQMPIKWTFTWARTPSSRA